MRTGSPATAVPRFRACSNNSRTAAGSSLSARSASTPADSTRTTWYRTHVWRGRHPSGNGSATSMQQSSATDLGTALVAALTECDFRRLAESLTPDVRMRALIPPGLVEISGAEAAAAKFASWFGDAEELELVHAGSDTF